MRVRRLLALALTSALVAAFFDTPGRAAADDSPEHSLQQIAALNRAIQSSRESAARYRQSSGAYESAVAAANARISEYAAQEAAAQSEVERLGSEIQIAQEQIALIGFQMSEAASLIEALGAEVRANEKTLATQEALYAQHLRSVYRQSQITPLEMLLSARSLTDFANRIGAITLIARQDRQLAASITDQRGALEVKRSAAQQQQRELDGLSQQVTAQRERLAADQERYQRLQAQAVSARVGAEDTRTSAAAAAAGARSAANQAAADAAALEREQAAAQQRYAELAATLQGSGKAWSGGKLDVWPLSGPITSSFGARWGGFHNGVDIAAPYYVPIRAAASGVVQVAGKPYLASGDTATVIIISHGSNLSTLYGHLDDSARPPVVRAGQLVRAGQIIGYNGSTGWSTGPHLHFMTIFNGRAVDPMPFLP